MARKDVLKDRVTGDVLYPLTAQECVLTRDGSGVATKNDVERGLANLVNSTPDYIDTIDSLKNRLSQNPDEALALAGEITDAKKAVFNDLWERACVYNGVRFGRHDKERNLYILNDVELTYEEAIYTYQRSASLYEGGPLSYKFYADSSIRTIFPIPFGACVSDADASMANIFSNCINLEIVVITTKYNAPNSLSGAFNGCAKLREIRGQIQSDYYKTNALLKAFNGCSSLQSVKIMPSKEGVDFSACPLLTFESIRYSVDGSRQKSAITITVHPNVFAALEGEAESYPFNGGSREGWEQLLQDATAKQIQFASA